ncbi:MAG: hypothetical protein D4R57_00040 [Verrucomicrobiales bacterium]|nr:MAG: hypothetical protein D4R57_00040 [Verrucomicrobiales bacterium]
MMRFIATMLAVLLVGLAGCRSQPVNPASAAPPPIPSGVGAVGLPDEEIQSARALYINKCARCHKFHNPAKYPDNVWNGWMTKMSRKAKLKSEQELILRRYLGLFRVEQNPSSDAGQQRP